MARCVLSSGGGGGRPLLKSTRDPCECLRACSCGCGFNHEIIEQKRSHFWFGQLLFHFVWLIRLCWLEPERKSGNSLCPWCLLLLYRTKVVVVVMMVVAASLCLNGANVRKMRLGKAYRQRTRISRLQVTTHCFPIKMISSVAQR